jgi:hypothetical protein
MAGPVVKTHYVSDTGVAYAIPAPTWQNTLAGNTAAVGTDVPAPKGFRARYRMIRNSANGREKKVKVGVITATFWTENMGTAHTDVDDGTTNGIPAATSAGRIGERQLDR